MKNLFKKWIENMSISDIVIVFITITIAFSNSKLTRELSIQNSKNEYKPYLTIENKHDVYKTESAGDIVFHGSPYRYYEEGVDIDREISAKITNIGNGLAKDVIFYDVTSDGNYNTYTNWLDDNSYNDGYDYVLNNYFTIPKDGCKVVDLELLEKGSMDHANNEYCFIVQYADLYENLYYDILYINLYFDAGIIETKYMNDGSKGLEKFVKENQNVNMAINKLKSKEPR